MKVPLRWLGEFVDLPTTDPAELALVLDMIGEKVEGYEELAADWSGVVVGQVVSIDDHPDADRIRVCQVDFGNGPSQIICGAWNFETGAYVPVAVPGAVLPGDFAIGRREIRGVASNGMICSERELGLGDDHTGILVLDGEPDLGTDFSDLVELPDVVFDLEITPNRPDAMSMLGIARDLAAHFDIPYRTPTSDLVTTDGKTRVEVIVEDESGCRRFTAREIRSVSVGRSPLWLRHRLSKVGVRAISNVVDVTNYVMFELGQPLHAFDADRITGNRLVVRRASPEEELVTLDGESRLLSPDDLIIYDDDGPTSMAGTMGGLRSEVSPETTSVLMEAASWDPPTIMYMSRRHDLRSEAATRFERGVDPDLADLANQRASALAARLGGGEVLEGSIDIVNTPTNRPSIELTLAEVTRILGPGFDSEHVSGILGRLGMEVTGSDPLQVVVPSYRPDVTRPADLIEEVARIHGYDKFDATIPLGPAGGLTIEQRTARKLRSTMVGLGLSQTVTLPFMGLDDLRRFSVDDDAGLLLRVKNPLREEESILRPVFLPSLLNVARYNLSRGAESVAIFEIGRVFHPTPSVLDERLPTEVERLAWVTAGVFGPTRIGDDPIIGDSQASLGIFRTIIRSLGCDNVSIRVGTAPGFHPGRTAEISIDGVIVGHVGELAPGVARELDLPGRVGVAELDVAPLLAPVPRRQVVSPSPFPPVDFDLSFLVPDEVPVGDLMSATVDAGGDLVESARVFDQFVGEGVEAGTRAVAISYRLRSAEKTLTNEDMSPVRAAMIAAGEALGCRLRGA